MFQLSVRPSELRIEAHNHGAKDSHTAQRDNCKPVALKGRVYVGLKVEIVLIVFHNPEPKISNDKRLDRNQDLDRTRNVSLYRLDMLARKLPPGSGSSRLRIPLIYHPGSIWANCALGNRLAVYRWNLSGLSMCPSIQSRLPHSGHPGHSALGTGHFFGRGPVLGPIAGSRVVGVSAFRDGPLVVIIVFLGGDISSRGILLCDSISLLLFHIAE